jgi:predicted nucleotidyltransferase
LLGSIAEGRHLLSSDIDVLIVTHRSPGEILAVLWEKGFKDPFGSHMVYWKHTRRRARLVRIG